MKKIIGNVLLYLGLISLVVTAVSEKPKGSQAETIGFILGGFLFCVPLIVIGCILINKAKREQESQIAASRRPDEAAQTKDKTPNEQFTSTGQK